MAEQNHCSKPNKIILLIKLIYANVKEIIEELIIKSCNLLIRLPTLCQAPQMCTLRGPFYCYHSITANNKLLFFNE